MYPGILTCSFFTRTTLASAGISCQAVVVWLSVSPSVTNRCSTDMVKCRITQTTRHDSPRRLVFWCRISAKLKRGHSQRRRQMQAG